MSTISKKMPKYIREAVRRIRRIEYLLVHSGAFVRQDNRSEYWSTVASRLSLTHLKQISSYAGCDQNYTVELFLIPEFKDAIMTALLERTIGLEE